MNYRKEKTLEKITKSKWRMTKEIRAMKWSVIWTGMTVLCYFISFILFVADYFDASVVSLITGLASCGLAFYTCPKYQYKYILYEDGKEFTVCNTKTSNGFADCENGRCYENMSFEYKKIKIENSQETNK